MKLFQRKTIFTRLVFTFMIVLLPIYIIGTGIYTYGISVVKNQILESIKDQITFKTDTLESDILLIRTMINNYTQDDDLIEISYSPNYLNDYERAVNIAGIQRRMQDIRDSSIFIDDIGIFIPAIDRVISTIGVIDPIDQEFLNRLKEEHTIYSNGLVFMDRRLFLISEYPFLSGNKSEKPIFMIYVEFSTNTIINFMTEFSDIDSVFIMTNSNLKGSISNTTNVELINTMNAMMKANDQKLNRENEIKVNGMQYLCISSKSAIFNVEYYTAVPINSLYKPLTYYNIWFWVFSVLCLAVLIIYSLSTYKYIHKPMLGLTSAFRTLEKGELNISIMSTEHNEFEYLYIQFNNTVRNLRELINQVYKQKILAQSIKLKYYQSQINPHFLYNTFFLLNNMVQERDMQNIEEFTNHLGHYFKYITKSHDDEVLLKDEVAHAKTYLEIQKKRFGDRIQVTVGELPKQCCNIEVPRLILQPVIENAYEHGLRNKLSGGILKFWFENNDEMVIIHLEDNGNDLSEEDLHVLNASLESVVPEGEGTGIINIHKRLVLRFGERSGITVERSDLGGLKVNIHILDEGA